MSQNIGKDWQHNIEENFGTPRKFEQRDEIFSLKYIQIVDKYQRQLKEEERQTWELCNFCSPICLTNWLSPEVMSYLSSKHHFTSDRHLEFAKEEHLKHSYQKNNADSLSGYGNVERVML